MRTRACLVPGAKRLLHIDIDDLIVLHLTQPNRIWQTHDIVVVLACLSDNSDRCRQPPPRQVVFSLLNIQE